MTTIEQRIRNCSRMIGVFGQREMEIAAIAILDAYWDRPFATIDESIFADDDSAREGFADLKHRGWINRNNVADRAFWRKVHDR